MVKEHAVKGNGAVDLLAHRPGEQIAVEVETGKSDIKGNITKIRDAGFDKIILLATSAQAVNACRKALNDHADQTNTTLELMIWLDVD